MLGLLRDPSTQGGGQSCPQLFSHLLLRCLHAKNSCDLPQAPHFLWIRFPPRKSVKFHACFHGSKNQKNCSKASKTLNKSTPKSIKKDFCEKLVFAIHPMRKPCFESPIQPDVDSQIGTKIDLKQKRKINSNVKPLC